MRVGEIWKYKKSKISSFVSEESKEYLNNLKVEIVDFNEKIVWIKLYDSIDSGKTDFYKKTFFKYYEKDYNE